MNAHQQLDNNRRQQIKELEDCARSLRQQLHDTAKREAKLREALELMLGCRDGETGRSTMAPCSWPAAEREARAALERK